jgi:hypothetical protein
MHTRFALAVVGLVVVGLSVAAARPPAARAAQSPTMAMKEAIVVIVGAIDRRGASRYFVYPTVSQVRRNGIPHAKMWPNDPWTGAPLTPGHTRGHYRYTVNRTRRHYRIVGYLGGGATCVISGGMPKSAKLAYDHRGEEGLNLIRQYVEKWARSHGDLYPPAAEVSDDGSVGREGGYWPSNPWDHGDMKQRSDRGSFSYKVSDDNTSYTLRLHRSLKADYVLTGSSPAAGTVSATDDSRARPLWRPDRWLLAMAAW